MADEGAADIPGEGLRSAFAISTEYVLTAWHCVRDASTHGDTLWFRLRVAEPGAPRHYAYLPVRVLSYNAAFDVAVLVVDRARLAEAGLSAGEAEKLMASSVIPLGVDVSVYEHVRVMGFPTNAPSADSDTLAARVVDLTLPLGEVTGLKLIGESFAAVDPVNPRGLSGGPVLKSRPAGTGDEGVEVAVGVVRGVPVGRYPDTALGGGLIATRVEDVAGLVPEIAGALLADVSGVPGSAQPTGTSLSGLLRADAELVDLQRLNLPARPETFIGRTEELKTLADTAGTVVITGVSGVGKTSLAAEYAHQCFFDQHSVDLIWWFNAANRVDLIAAMTIVYSKLTGGGHIGDAELGAQQLRNWLENCPYNWLMVFDNADESDIEGLYCQGTSGRTLITSRRSSWHRMLTIIDLETLSRPDAQLLLERTTDRSVDPSDYELITELGGLSLAIEQAGTFMRRTGWSTRRYLDELRVRPDALYAQNLSAPERAIARVIDNSIQQAARVPGGERAADLLGVLAYLAADNIPTALLDQSVGQDLIGEDLEKALALNALREYSLATRNADNIRVLPIVQHLVRLHLEHFPRNVVGGQGQVKSGKVQNLDVIYRHAAVAANMVTFLGEETTRHTPITPKPGGRASSPELLAWYPHYTIIRDHLERIREAQGSANAAFAVAKNLSRLVPNVTQALGSVGTVKWFNSQKGFGFIESSEGDVFVHISVVERAGLRGLKEGQKVIFQVVLEKGRRSASDVSAA